MRVLLITQDFPPQIGGIQTFVTQVARGLAARCEAFAVVAPRLDGDAAVDASLPFKVHRVRTFRHGLMPVLGAPSALGAVRRFSPDIVLHGQWQTLTIGLLARKLGWTRNVAVVTYGRELRLQALWPFSPAVTRLCGATLRGADAVAVISRYTGTLTAARGVDSSRIHPVGCGTDPVRFHPVDPTAFRARFELDRAPIVLTLGRLVPHKGIDTVIRAMPDVLKAVPEARYVIAGRGPDDGRLRALVADMGVAQAVRFIGRIEDTDLNDCYSACDVFVTASREIPPSVEGFGIVFLEAGACEKPVIGTITGGIPDAIADGESGFLVPPDDPPALAERIVQLLRDPVLRQQMGERGRRRVIQACSWDRTADRLFEVLRTTLN